MSKVELHSSFITNCSGTCPRSHHKATLPGYKLVTNGIQFYAIAHLDKTSLSNQQKSALTLSESKSGQDCKYAICSPNLLQSWLQSVDALNPTLMQAVFALECFPRTVVGVTGRMVLWNGMMQTLLNKNCHLQPCLHQKGQSGSVFGSWACACARRGWY